MREINDSKLYIETTHINMQNIIGSSIGGFGTLRYAHSRKVHSKL